MNKITLTNSSVVKRSASKRPVERGASLVEALVAMAILSFVIVSILGGLSQQQMSTRKTGEKNTAILLAERRMEELMKFPAPQLQAETYVDYIVHSGHELVVYDENQQAPDTQMQFRRTTAITIDMLQEMADIRVMVEYGRKKDIYPFRVELSSRRWKK